MNHALSFCLVISLFSIMCGEAIACGEDPVLKTVSSSRSEGANITTRRGLFIPLDRLRKAPIWSPGQGEIPLSASDANDLALAWAKQFVAATSKLEVAEIALKPCRELNTWYYVVLFNFADVTTVAVLLDGTLIGLTDIG